MFGEVEFRNIGNDLFIMRYYDERIVRRLDDQKYKVLTRWYYRIIPLNQKLFITRIYENDKRMHGLIGINDREVTIEPPIYKNIEVLRTIEDWTIYTTFRATEEGREFRVAAVNSSYTKVELIKTKGFADLHIVLNNVPILVVVTDFWYNISDIEIYKIRIGETIELIR